MGHALSLSSLGWGRVCMWRRTEVRLSQNTCSVRPGGANNTNISYWLSPLIFTTTRTVANTNPMSRWGSWGSVGREFMQKSLTRKWQSQAYNTGLSSSQAPGLSITPKTILPHSGNTGVVNNPFWKFLQSQHYLLPRETVRRAHLGRVWRGNSDFGYFHCCKQIFTKYLLCALCWSSGQITSIEKH